jgi:hypothetical protein
MAILAGAKVDAADTAALGVGWTAYTPTLGNVTGGVGTFAYLLVGKTLLLRGNLTAGTATAAGLVTVTLPAGMTGAAIPQYLGVSQSRTQRMGILNNGTNVLELNNSDGSTFTLAFSLVALRWAGVLELA